jgi:DNA-binding transcriptional regulator YdaS (Cro superfamily)
MDNLQLTGLERAIKIAGGPTALARGVGVKSHNVVLQWLRNRVPAEHCPVIERITGVICEELRPDVEWSVLRVCAPPPTSIGARASQVEAVQGVA